MELGLACHVCGQLNPIGGQSCGRCGTVLAPAAIPPPTQPVVASQPAAAPVLNPPPRGPAATTAPAGPATPPPPRFDPTTGQPLEAPPDGPSHSPKTMFFGALQQQPVVPRLVVIKGEGGDGATYHLQGTTTVVGRSKGDINFAEDPFLSPTHARFTAQAGRLFVQDLETTNGVFVRIKQPTPLEPNGLFLVGEQLLKLDAEPFSESATSANETYFYGSPKPAGAFRVVQHLAGGGDGRIAVASGTSLSMGREGSDMSFPADRFISGHHARLDVRSDDGRVVLTDTGSRNGTFVRLNGAQELVHGDYLFVGQQLLRVEIA